MWQVVYIASNKIEAEKIINIMESEGFMVEMEGSGSGNYQIKVPAAEAEDAYSCLHNNF